MSLKKKILIISFSLTQTRHLKHTLINKGIYDDKIFISTLEDTPPKIDISEWNISIEKVERILSIYEYTVIHVCNKYLDEILDNYEKFDKIYIIAPEREERFNKLYKKDLILFKQINSDIIAREDGKVYTSYVSDNNRYDYKKHLHYLPPNVTLIDCLYIESLIDILERSKIFKRNKIKLIGKSNIQKK